MEQKKAPELEFVMSVRITLGTLKRLGNVTNGGQRCFINILEGTFEGPNIKGKVLPDTGGDYARVRPDGTLDFDARYLLQEEDGTIIYLQNRGYRWGSEEVMKKLSLRQDVDISEYYMRTSPTFEVEAGRHDWLSKHIFVGIGEKTPEGNVINYFKVL